MTHLYAALSEAGHLGELLSHIQVRVVSGVEGLI